MGDFDEFIDDLVAGEDDGLPAPTWRATIRRGQLTLTNWAPFLATNGPLGSVFPGRQRAGVAIADLTIHGDDADEVSVRYWAEGTDRAVADALLTTWAEDVGYRRLWLPDFVVELEPHPERLERAAVRCPTCRAHWSDGTPEFWLLVRGAKVFPKWCPLCGCELPQWQVVPPATRRKSNRGSSGDERKSVRSLASPTTEQA